MSDNSPSEEHSQAALTADLEVYDAFRRYVQHEDTLVNNRVMWLLTIHGFLYATYGFTLQKKLEVAEKVKDLVSLPERLKWSLVEIEIFLIIIALIGVVISGYALKSIRAAAEASENVVRLIGLKFPPQPQSDQTGTKSLGQVLVLGSQDNFVKMPLLGGGGLSDAMRRGSSAALTIPKWLCASWGIAIFVTLVYLWENSYIVPNLFQVH